MKYFHLIANGIHRKKIIFQLEQAESTIIGQENLKTYIAEYYKRHFGAAVPNNFSMEESETHDITQLSEEENILLTVDFSEKEVYDTIMQMEKNKPPGPDGFPAEFYQTCWDFLK